MAVADFAAQIKQGTKESHSAAENTKFVASFLRGVLDPQEYRKLIANFYFVYSAMEEEVEALKDHPVVGKINLPELPRKESLKEDLSYYYGPSWETEIKQSEACVKYVNRIREIAKDDPNLLVGHHYTRYLGDLSGGQILRGIAENSLKPEKGKGLSFYDFSEISDSKNYKKVYRQLLDGLDVAQDDVDLIIREANYAFKLNMYMFEELEGSASKSFVKLLCNFVKSKLGLEK
jgi:heme oxygenase